MTPRALLLLYAALSLPGAGFAQTGTLILLLEGFESDTGAAGVAMWSGAPGWLADDTAVEDVRRTISNGKCRVVLTSIPYGEYAISAYHDVNDNGRLDTGLFGIPREPIGTSNDAAMRFGPPRYEDARFELDQPELELRIQLKKIF